MSGGADVMTSSEVESDPNFESALALMKEKDYTQAAEILSNVLQNSVEKYGELGVECSEVYYQYGLALLREFEAKEDAEGGPDVFGQAVPKEVPTGTEGGEAGPSTADGGQEGEEGAEGEAGEEGEEGEGGEEEEGGEDEEGGEEEDGEQEEADNDGGEGNSSGDKGKSSAAEEQNGDVDDPLQLAWEVLDVCRNILEKNTLDPLKLADTHALLGDINLRNDQFDLALTDYNKCLEIRETVCCNDDRLLIEVHHQLAMTHISHPQPQKVEALVHWRAAVEVCDRRVANLARLVAMDGEGSEMKGSSVKPQPKSWSESEMNEIEEIAEDIKGRIEAEETQDESALAAAAGSSNSNGKASAATAGAGSSLGADALKELAAAVGLGGSGFAQAPVGAPVKTLGTFGKKGKAAKAGEKRPAEGEAGKGQGGAGEGKKAKTETDASAAPTPAREEAAAK